MIPNTIDFNNTIVFNEFMENRVVELEDGDIISEGLFFDLLLKLSIKI